MAVGNHGDRKVVAERVTAASDHQYGVEVSPSGCYRLFVLRVSRLIGVSDGCAPLGGVSHGPRGPTSYYYMLPMKVRVQGLKVALSAKVAQVIDGSSVRLEGVRLKQISQV